MPRPRNRFPSLVRHRPTGRARVRWAGKDFYLGRHGSPEAEAAYRLFVADVAAGRDPAARFGDGPADDRLTVSGLVVAYVRHAGEYHREPDGTHSAEATRVRLSLRPVVELFGLTPVDEFGPVRLGQVRDAMVASGLARTTVNDRVKAVRRMFKWGVARELVAPDTLAKLAALDGLRKGRTEAREPEPVAPADPAAVDRVLPELSKPVAAMVRLEALTGARPGEIVRLRPGELVREGDVWEYRPPRHKNDWRGKGRVIFVGPRAQEVLGPFLTDRPADKPCFSPAEAAAEMRAARAAGRVTPASCGNQAGTNRRAAPERTPGEGYTVASYRRAVRRACEKAGVEPFTPNQLRHLAGTAVRREYGLEGAQAVLGHAHAKVTEVYAERDHEKARSVAREMG